MTPLHRAQKALQDYENKHGFEKTKSLVTMYDVPLWKYDYRVNSKKYCHDCGVEIFEKVRCKECGENAYIAVYGKDRYDKYHN